MCPFFFNSCINSDTYRPKEANGKAGGRRHAGRDEGGEEEDGHGEEGVHPGALSLPSVPPAHYYFHPAAALSAAVWDQRCELGIQDILSGKASVKMCIKLT